MLSKNSCACLKSKQIWLITLYIEQNICKNNKTIPATDVCNRYNDCNDCDCACASCDCKGGDEDDELCKGHVRIVFVISMISFAAFVIIGCICFTIVKLALNEDDFSEDLENDSNVKIVIEKLGNVQIMHY